MPRNKLLNRTNSLAVLQIFFFCCILLFFFFREREKEHKVRWRVRWQHLCALYWRRTTLPGAIAGMLTGAATVIIWNNFIAPLGGWFAVYELLPGFVLALLVIIVVSKLTPEPSKEVTDDFDTYMELDV